MNLSLPKEVDINGKKYAIRYDFRVILEIIAMIGDVSLSGADKTEALLQMFYVDYEDIDDYKGAVDAALAFMAMYKESDKKHPRLMDWEQDFDYIIAPVNHVLGYEARAVEYNIETNTGGVHWFTFLSAYMEISPDSTYSQIIHIRDKQMRGKPLEKYEKSWLRQNKDIVMLKQRFTSEEEERFKELLGE